MRGDEHKHDDGKLMWDLLPIEFAESVVKVLTFGAKKYEPNGWKNVPNAEERYYAALMRHIAAWRKGEMIDEESGLHHLEHAACNLMFLLNLPQEQEYKVEELYDHLWKAQKSGNTLL